MKIMRVTPFLSFLRKQCMKNCGIKPTMPGELGDEENDPYQHHPSLPPDVVSSAYFINIQYLYSFAPNYPMKKGVAHLKRSEMLVLLPRGVYQGFGSRLGFSGKTPLFQL